MKLLLDTHVFIWSLTGDQRLPPSTPALLAAAENELFLSPISVYEMAIKIRLGKLTLGLPLMDFVKEGIRRSRLTELPVRISHSGAAENLPLHHKDPFDRLLIATAISDGLGFVTADSEIRNYPVRIVW